jgi:hypothetical protein
MVVMMRARAPEAQCRVSTLTMSASYVHPRKSQIAAGKAIR